MQVSPKVLVTLKTNLHSHTQFCDARCTMEQMLRAAIDAGFSTWGFTPHAPVNIESPCNMKKENVGDYLNEILRLRSHYPKIKILAGMEVDFIDEMNGPASPEIVDYHLDYVIGSVHFIPNQKGEYHDIDGSPENFRKTLDKYFDGDIYFVVKKYWEQVQKMISSGGFDILGHIDKIALNASSVIPEIELKPFYETLAIETIKMAITSGKAIEINTKHWEKYSRFFPHQRYWPLILNAGIKMPVNSDTHYAEKVDSGIQAAINEILKLYN